MCRKRICYASNLSAACYNIFQQIGSTLLAIKYHEVSCICTYSTNVIIICNLHSQDYVWEVTDRYIDIGRRWKITLGVVVNSEHSILKGNLRASRHFVISFFFLLLASHIYSYLIFLIFHDPVLLRLYIDRVKYVDSK